MCGIAGYYSATGADKNTLLKMANAIAHRGPDAEGTYIHESFGLAHRRLSILDLSSASHQPMLSKCGRYIMVYNGEVYNYKELKEELNLTTQTSSDTEVILEAFALMGPAMVNKLNGMFAIAILDRLENKLFLFRDRLGIKPLYVYQSAGTLAFASELKAITSSCDTFPVSLNNEAIPYFLHLGYIPEPMSIYNEVTKFPVGHWAVFDSKILTTSCFWSAKDKIKADVWVDEASAKEKLDELLTASVKRRLISDVPFGTFLSGGIDSSIVTALAQKVSSKPINTFSIGFEKAKYNEAHFAKQVSNHLGTIHHEFTVTEKDALDLVLEIVPQFDEPFSDSSAIPTMLVSKLARKHVTMTLSGDGGDELFMGYGAYIWAERLQNPLLAALRQPISGLLALGNDRSRRVSKLLDFDFNSCSQSHTFSQEQNLFSAKEIGELVKNTSETTPLIKNSFGCNDSHDRKLSPQEIQAFFDLNYYLKDDLLVKVDRSTMRYGLETRVPLLDHTVVEFAINLSPSLKIKDGCSKYLLKEVLFNYVPKELFARPKWGFSIPLSDWLQSDLAFLIDEYLNEKSITTAGLVNWDNVKSLTMKFRNGHHYLYNRLWLLIILHQWHNNYAKTN